MKTPGVQVDLEQLDIGEATQALPNPKGCSQAALELRQQVKVWITVVGGCVFWLFVLAGGPPYILYTYLAYRLYTLCIYSTIYMFGGPPAMWKTRPPTTMVWIARGMSKDLFLTTVVEGYTHNVWFGGEKNTRNNYWMRFFHTSMFTVHMENHWLQQRSSARPHDLQVGSCSTRTDQWATFVLEVQVSLDKSDIDKSFFQ